MGHCRLGMGPITTKHMGQARGKRMLTYRLIITRDMLRAESETLFVFGDNLLRKGLGGQAKEMCGEPNAVGIPTKKWPAMSPGAFLTDYDFRVWSNAAAPNLKRLREHQGKIIWPWHGIGTGLAQLQTRAPMIWRTLEAFRMELEIRKSTIG